MLGYPQSYFFVSIVGSRCLHVSVFSGVDLAEVMDLGETHFILAGVERSVLVSAWDFVSTGNFHQVSGLFN